MLMALYGPANLKTSGLEVRSIESADLVKVTVENSLPVHMLYRMYFPDQSPYRMQQLSADRANCRPEGRIAQGRVRRLLEAPLAYLGWPSDQPNRACISSC